MIASNVSRVAMMQCYSVQRHLNHALYNKAHSVIGKPHLVMIASNVSRVAMYFMLN